MSDSGGAALARTRPSWLGRSSATNPSVPDARLRTSGCLRLSPSDRGLRRHRRARPDKDRHLEFCGVRGFESMTVSGQRVPDGRGHERERRHRRARVPVQLGDGGARSPRNAHIQDHDRRRPRRDREDARVESQPAQYRPEGLGPVRQPRHPGRDDLREHRRAPRRRGDGVPGRQVLRDASERTQQRCGAHRRFADPVTPIAPTPTVTPTATPTPTP